MGEAKCVLGGWGAGRGRSKYAAARPLSYYTKTSSKLNRSLLFKWLFLRICSL